MDKLISALKTTYEDPVPLVFLSIALFATMPPLGIAYVLGYIMHTRA